MECKLMKILIISDSHGMDKNLKYVINKVKPIDMLIHLGDFNGNYDYIAQLAECPVEAVCGNNDFFCDIEDEKLINIADKKVFMSHGHKYGVSYSPDRIKSIGMGQDVDIIMFGHTHIPLIDKTSGVWTINPGSISLPRQANRLPTYIIMDVDNYGDVHFTLKYIKKVYDRIF